MRFGVTPHPGFKSRSLRSDPRFRVGWAALSAGSSDEHPLYWRGLGAADVGTGTAAIKAAAVKHQQVSDSHGAPYGALMACRRRREHPAKS